MTFQPPPPPPPPGTPSGGQPARQAFDPKSINPLDWGILGVGALTFIFSFFGYYSVSVGPYSTSWSAWHFGGGAFIAWFAMVLAVLGAAGVACALFAPQIQLAWPPRLLGLTLSAIGSLLYIIAIFVHPKFYDEGGISFGHGFSFWISLIFSLAITVGSVMRVQQTGQQLPGALANLPNIGAYGPQTPSAGGQPPAAGGQPPAPGVQPPSGAVPPPPPPGSQEPQA